CDKPKTDFGYTRIIQRAFHQFKERVPSNVQLAWLNQITMRLNKEYAEYIKKYNRLPYIAEFEIHTY
ncbi:37039_t:CDS:2, partial [Gigaspora margarita]